jgi:excisionase family DNA binding protein
MNVDRRELAAHLKVSIDTVRKWERMGLIPRIKIGHVIRFNLAKVEAALEKLERKAGV